eukprot:1938663-Pyramimonas_sp.AAC.1
MAQNGSRNASGSPGWPPSWFKRAQNAAPRGPNTRRNQMATENPQGGRQNVKHRRHINVFGSLAFSLPVAFQGLHMAQTWPNNAPREDQERPNMAPGTPKNAPSPSQEEPKRRCSELPKGEAD